MSYSAPPPNAGTLRMLAGSSLKYENQLWIARRLPIRPDATSSRTPSHDGCSRYMKASINRTPSAAQARTISSPSATVIASGFSHRTCLPARAAAIVHAACSWLGSGM